MRQGRAAIFGDPLGRGGLVLWQTLTDVRFAVLQIIVLASAGLVGTMVRQIPSAALHDPAGYAVQLADLHARYDPLTLFGQPVGPTLVVLFERLQLFWIFNSAWFAALLTLLVVSIVVCTLDRLPRLWHGVHNVRIVQPAAFFDRQLNERAAFTGTAPAEADVARALRRARYRLRTAVAGDGSRYLYGDRNQYFKLATLITHVGLVLFLVGGAVTGLLGFETVIFVPDGGTAPVQPVGTPDNLLVKNLGFSAPRRADGSFADFSTDLAVFRGGRQIARQVIRVNEPLVVDGFVFHQNTFGPAEVLQIRDGGGALVWDGPVNLEGQALGKPQGFLTIPGSPVGLFVVLDRDASGEPQLTLLGFAQPTAESVARPVFGAQLAPGGATDAATTGGYAVTWSAISAFSGMVVKKDPGQALIWLAYLCLIGGLVLTFYFPRRRIWARFDGTGVQLAMLADRYVDAGREFDRLLARLVGPAGGPPERGPTR